MGGYLPHTGKSGETLPLVIHGESTPLAAMGENVTLNGTGYPEYDISVGDVFVGLVLGCLIFAIIFGNGLVIVSVAMFKRMRTPSTLLIASLAAADCLVAIMVLPISLYREMTKVWLLGPVICDYWITCDVFFCTSSMLNVCVIALDRYFKITKNVDYTHNKTIARPKVCVIMACGAWVVALLIGTTPLLGWYRGNERQKPYECMISQDLGYTIFSTFGAFYIPMVALIVVYCRIYKYAILRLRNRTKEMKRKRSSTMAMLSNETTNGNGNSPQTVSKSKRKEQDSSDRSKRSAKMLGVIIGCFVCCWMPFFLLASITPFCPECKVPSAISSIALWLGYFNSFCNPCIYAVWNKQYRESFIALLKCDIANRHSTNRRRSLRNGKITQSNINGARTLEGTYTGNGGSTNDAVARKGSILLVNYSIPDCNKSPRGVSSPLNGVFTPSSRKASTKIFTYEQSLESARNNNIETRVTCT